MVTNIMAYVTPGPMEIIVIFFILTFASILPMIVFWKICSKAGFPGVLSLLMIVPIGNIILPLYLAFAKWPALKNDNQS